MRNFLLFSFLIILLSCNHSPEKSGKNDQKIFSIGDTPEGGNEITCWGIGGVDLDNDMQSLEEKVGKENISMDSLLKEGMFEGFVTKLWKGTDKEIVVHWKEKKAPFQNIDFLEITQSTSPYHFVNGIKIGTSLKDIVTLNGDTPVNLYGFGWDYGGTFIDFNKGKLSGDLPCFGGVFRLPEEARAEETKSITGDKKISSSDPVIQKYEVKLAVIRVKNI